VIGWVHDHVPGSAVRVRLSCCWPEIVGRVALRGAVAVGVRRDVLTLRGLGLRSSQRGCPIAEAIPVGSVAGEGVYLEAVERKMIEVGEPGPNQPWATRRLESATVARLDFESWPRCDCDVPQLGNA
jgi:hypothetical protein